MKRRLILLGLLMLTFARQVDAAVRLSATVDEGFHITSGYEYLRTGHLRLFDEHVPLVKAWLAWPLLFVPDLSPPESAPGYADGDLIRVAQATVLAYRPLDRVVVAPRVPIALLTLLLVATVYRWAADVFGWWGGVLAAALLALDPNVLAHGSLATTDVGATAFIFWATMAVARYLRRPTRGRWWAAALLLGLAQLAKLTALLLFPTIGLLFLADALTRAGKLRCASVVRPLVAYGGMVGVALVVVWAGYGFEVRPVEGIALPWPVPAASHVERWLRLQANLAYGREAFLLGQNRMHGWWYYFPVAFALKTPLPTLILLGWTAWALAWGMRLHVPAELSLGLFPAFYGAASLTSTINIGYRHLLPALPFLYVSAGRVLSTAGEGGRLRRRAGALLVLWLAVEGVALHPHYLAYFNVLAGGPDEGYRFLADSNTDWGQTLKELAAYQQAHDLGAVRLSQFTFLDPAAYGVHYEPIAPMRGAPPVLPRRFHPAPGLYAISATTLDGVPLPLPATFDWFRHREPQVRLGHVMFLYDVPATDPAPAWLAQCTRPVAPLSSQAVAEGFGGAVQRQLFFDCEQSWVWPGGGASAGWYALTTPDIDRPRWPGREEAAARRWWPAWTTALPLAPLRLSYVQPAPTELPPFAIWVWPTGVSIRPPHRLPGDEVTFDAALTLLGYDAPSAVRAGEEMTVLTFWRVAETAPLPFTRPLSLMLHLRRADGTPLAVGDGLGVPAEQWRAGDVIVQRHALSIPADAPPGHYRLVAGVYWLDEMRLWGAEENGNYVVLLDDVSVVP